jgi:hypothetical protein
MALLKFSTQAPDVLLQEMKKLAKSEGKQFQYLVMEAFSDLLEKRSQSKPRKHVIAAFESSLESYDSVYKTLAK